MKSRIYNNIKFLIIVSYLLTVIYYFVYAFNLSIEINLRLIS